MFRMRGYRENIMSPEEIADIFSNALPGQDVIIVDEKLRIEVIEYFRGLSKDETVNFWTYIHYRRLQNAYRQTIQSYKEFTKERAVWLALEKHPF